MRRQQTVALRSHIAHLQLQVSCQFAFDCQVVLRRILAPQVRLKLPEELNGPEHSPVHSFTAWRIQNAVMAVQRRQTEWIRVGEVPTLIEKGLVKQSVGRECTAPKRRLGAELLEHQLLDRVVE